MNAQLRFGAITTLAGAAAGGLISYMLSRQQFKEARAQRVAAEGWERARRSSERRFDVYKDYLTQARRFRNAIRPPHDPGPGLRMPIPEIDDLARTADAAGSAVFLVSESIRTREACAILMRTAGAVVGAVHDFGHAGDVQLLNKLNDDIAQALRDFQAAAREELGVEDARIPTLDGTGSA